MCDAQLLSAENAPEQQLEEEENASRFICAAHF
jgi:hypothetical protein